MKKKLSKRGKLFLANGIAVIVFFIIGYGAALGETPFDDWFRVFSLYFVLLQVLFTFFSLIVYYLSIIADALNKKYAEQEKENKDKK